MNNLFVDAKYLDILIAIFKEYCPNIEVFAYGSRLSQKAHEGSDLDVIIKNFPNDKHLFELKEIISRSNIPFLVDINLYEKIPQSLQEEFEKNNVKIYP